MSMKEKEMKKAIKEYGKKLSKMSQEEFCREWESVMNTLNPERKVKRVTPSSEDV